VTDLARSHVTCLTLPPTWYGGPLSYTHTRPFLEACSSQLKQCPV
jgi:hypothetical protein